MRLFFLESLRVSRDVLDFFSKISWLIQNRKIDGNSVLSLLEETTPVEILILCALSNGYRCG